MAADKLGSLPELQSFLCLYCFGFEAGKAKAQESDFRTLKALCKSHLLFFFIVGWMPACYAPSSKDNCCTFLQKSSIIDWVALYLFWEDFANIWCCNPAEFLMKGLLIRCRKLQQCRDPRVKDTALFKSYPNWSTLALSRPSTFYFRSICRSYRLIRASNMYWWFWFAHFHWWECCSDAHCLSSFLTVKICCRHGSYCIGDTKSMFKGIPSSFWICFVFLFRGWIRNNRILAA